MSKREIKFYVNARDLEIIKLALKEQRTKLKRLNDKIPSFISTASQINELNYYMDELCEKVDNLRSHHPYKPKQESEE